MGVRMRRAVMVMVLGLHWWKNRKRWIWPRTSVFFELGALDPSVCRIFWLGSQSRQCSQSLCMIFCRVCRMNSFN